MKTLETFITKSYNLEDALGKIQKQEVPEFFDQEFLEDVGIEKPNSIHYTVLFKNLGLVDENKKPVDPYYIQFVESEELAKKVIAERMQEAYQSIFEAEDRAYRLSSDQLFDLFKDLMGPGKSETFIQLVANTFFALAEYADWEGQIPTDEQEDEGIEEITMEETVSAEASYEEDTGEFEEPKNQHDEFILELIHGYSDHDYQEQVKELANNQNSENTYNGNGHHTSVIDSPSSDTPASKEENSQNRSVELEPEEDTPTSSEDNTSEIFSGLEEMENNSIESETPEDEKQNISASKEEPEEPEQEENTSSVKEEQSTGKNMNQTKKTDNGPIGLRTHAEHVKIALKKRASLLTKMERYREALDAYEQIILYTKSDEVVDTKELSDAIYQKAVILEKLRRYDEALEAYNDLIEQYNWNGLE